MGSESTTRAAKALATRRRMVNAAYVQFCANGYLGTTITAVAKDAGVAILVAEQNAALGLELGQRGYVLHNGALAMHGDCEQRGQEHGERVIV